MKVSRPVMEHQLKTWPRLFKAVDDGLKSFEVRQFDRDFRAGDYLLLLEYEPETKSYTGRSLSMVVLAVYDNVPGIKDGYCVMEVSRDWDCELEKLAKHDEEVVDG